MNPGFGGDELEGEAEPEGGAEEFVGVRPERRLVAKKADDWTDGGDSEADCRCKTISRRRDQPRIEAYYIISLRTSGRVFCTDACVLARSLLSCSIRIAASMGNSVAQDA